ncbi:MAG TPA: class I adenylate-forming enzyme family protein [Syntrophales bacterium]|nr:class I adenylate-forming enzyme family protein [Syntrophales bacterium]
MIVASQKQIREWTEKGAWGTKTFIDFFRERVSQGPDKVCLVDPLNKKDLVGLEPERLTYTELAHAVDATAEGLIAKGIHKDDIVMVQLPNCWELAMLYLAITRTGACISPLPMQWRFSELEYIAGLSEARAIITVEEFHGFNHREMAEKIQSQNSSLHHIIMLDEIRKMSRGPVSGILDDIEIDANDVLTLCWSSGTEAQPKGCPLSHNNWYNQSMAQIDSAGIEPDDNFITAGPLVNMASIGTVYFPWLIVGGKLVLHHPFDGPGFVLQLMMEEINYTLLVPAVINALLKHPRVDEFDLSKMRAITLGSAPPSLWSVQELKRRWGIEFGNIWGQNEGTGFVSGRFDIPDMETRVDHFPQYGKVGTKWNASVTDFVHSKIIDPATREELTEVGNVGELWYRGPNVIPCYFKRPDITEKAFDSEGFFNTGDLFQIKKGDCVGFFDRTKDIIIRGGFNISAQEVENMLLGHPKVADIAAVSMPDEAMGEKLCVYAVPREGETLILEDLTSFMKDKGVAVYKLPERLEVVSTIPRNPVGKVLKTDLRADIVQKLKSGT